MSKNRWMLIAGSLVLILVVALTPSMSACSSPAPAPASSPAATSTSSPAGTSAVPKELWGGIKYLRCEGTTAGNMAQQIWEILADKWSQIPGIKASVSPGSDAADLFDVSEGKAEAGQAPIGMYLRFMKGQDLPQGKVPPANVRHFWTTNLLGGVIWVRADSNFKTLEDLKKARIASNDTDVLKANTYSGAPLAILEAYGITPKTITQWGGQINKMSDAAGFDALRDKTIDAILTGGSPTGPSSIVIPVEQTIGLRIIPVPMDVLKKAAQLYPQYGIAQFDWTSTIKSEKAPLSTLADANTFYVNASIPDDLMYEMLKQMFETDAMARIRAIGQGQWSKWLENAMNNSENWNIHPGAAKYYKDKGIKPRDSWLVKEK
jgi:uncharacterized protein